MKRIFFLLLITSASLFSSSIAMAAPAPPDTVAITMQYGASAKYGSINLIDQVNGNYIAPTAITNLVIQNQNPDVAAVTMSTTTSVKVAAVAGGTGTATVSCHVVYTDPGDGLQKSEDKTIVVAYTVNYTPPHGAKLALLFN